MSGKYERKSKKKSAGGKVILALILLLLLAAAAVAVWLLPDFASNEGPVAAMPTEENTEMISSEEYTSEPLMVLQRGLQILEIGSYSGAFVEDGTRDEVSDVLMIVVENASDEWIQYAEITLVGEGVEANFTLSTLYPGDRVVLLEQNRMPSSDEFTSAYAESVAVFAETPSAQSDKVQIQLLDGGLNIINVSGEDIDGEIVIYFKNYVDGAYLGGITYLGRIEGGLKTGEIRQVMSTNVTATETVVVFVTIA